MISRITRLAKTYYSAQADLAYWDSLVINNANSNTPVATDEASWMAQAEKARTRLSAATEEIRKLGGTISDDCVYDGRGQLIPSRLVLV